MGCDTDRIVLNFNRFRHESAFTQLMKRVNTVNSTRRCDGAVRAHNTAWLQRQPNGVAGWWWWSECSVSQSPCVRALQSSSSSGHQPASVRQSAVHPAVPLPLHSIQSTYPAIHNTILLYSNSFNFTTRLPDNSLIINHPLKLENLPFFTYYLLIDILHLICNHSQATTQIIIYLS